MYSAQTKLDIWMVHEHPWGRFRITLRNGDQTKQVILEADDRSDATFKAEATHAGWHMVIAEKLRGNQ